MNQIKYIGISLILGVVIGISMMVKYKLTGEEWVVSPEQIANAKAQGKMGVENDRGSVTVLPIRRDGLEVKAITFGVMGAVICFVLLGRRSLKNKK